MRASPPAPTRAVIANASTCGSRSWRKASERGRVIVLLPSLGRGASDFEPIAERLAGAGYRVLRPQPRGIGHSRVRLHGIDLHDCAADVAAVIAHEGSGPAFVVGHAFGNRVARMLATDRPDLVRAVALVAANIGKAPSPPQVRAAIRASADPSLPDEERIEALQFAFFAPGNDPRSWLEGWHPEVLQAQRIAGDRTSREEDFAAGRRRSSTCSPSTIRWRMSRTPGLPGQFGEARDRRGGRARESRGDRRAAGRRQRGADLLCAQAVARPRRIAWTSFCRKPPVMSAKRLRALPLWPPAAIPT